jgi:hypothetical protein
MAIFAILPTFKQLLRQKSLAKKFGEGCLATFSTDRWIDFSQNVQSEFRKWQHEFPNFDKSTSGGFSWQQRQYFFMIDLTGCLSLLKRVN